MSKGTKIFLGVFVILFLVAVAAVIIVGTLFLGITPVVPNPPIADNSDSSFEFKKFTSEEEMKAYLVEADQGGYSSRNGLIAGNLPATDGAVQESAPITPDNTGDKSYDPDRYSTTNVQVKGIDEPDIVKTDGKNLFLSSDEYFYAAIDAKPMLESQTNTVSPQLTDPEVSSQRIAPGLPYPYPTPVPLKTRIVGAVPPTALTELSNIDFNGDLLLQGNILMVINPNAGIKAYNVTDKSNPKLAWEMTYEDNFYYSTARLFNGKLYLVLNSYIYGEGICPIKPLKGGELTIACTDIYYPIGTNQSSNITNILMVNAETGKVEDSLNYMGDQYANTFYMSEKNLYLTFQKSTNPYDFFLDYIDAKGSEVISQDDINKIKKIDGYEISENSKMNEISLIMNNYQYKDGKENEAFKNSVMSYLETVKRDISKTEIVKVDLINLEISATGSIPGSLLNQFSLDEYQNNLRVSTTIGDSWFVGGTSETNVNDVYVLDANLKIIGSALDMGKGERIYATRFMGDTAYVVTFKQTDPFYVLDLTNPTKPEIKGELKIPGFSSYLHQLEDNLVLGIGSQDNNVKLSLFDVSDASNPVEVSNMVLKGVFWSEAANNHHAFMQDSMYKVFFIPAEGRGMIISYDNNKLSLTKEIKNSSSIKRALYISDYLYVIGSDKITVIDEKNNWEEVKTLSLK